MGIFDRVKSGVRGKAEGLVRGVEERNPEAVFDAAVEGQVARMAELKDRTAAVMVRRQREADKVAGLEREAAQLMEALRGALDEGDEETALVLQVRRQEVEAAQEEGLRTVASLEEQVEALKAGLVAAQDGARALRHEKDGALAQLGMAQAMIDVQEATDGLGTSAQARSLDSVRSSIERLQATAHEGWRDADGNSVRGKAEALGRKAGEQSARDQLAELKRQKAGLTSDED